MTFLVLDHQAMPNQRPDLAAKLAHCMAERGETPKDVATLIGVRPPSVYDWLKHGRIAKKHLPVLAQHYGYPLTWWLDADPDDEEMLTLDERDLIDTYRNLPEELKANLASHAKLLKTAAPAPEQEPKPAGKKQRPK